MAGNMGPTSASFSPDGRLALTCDGMGDTFLWRLYQPNTPVVDLSNELERPNFASFRSDGKSILTADISGRVKRWRIDQLDGQHKAVFQGTLNQWTRMAFFSPDGNYLVIPRQVDREALQNTALLFKLEESAIQEVPPQVDGQIERRGVAFSSDGKLVVTAGDDFTMRVWKVDKPESPLAVLRGHEGTARAAAFSKDGQFIATAGIDRVRIWRVDQPMAIASHDRTSRNWIARLDELIQLAGKTAGRNLSRAEWQEYFPGSPNRKTFVWLSETPESEPAIQVESPTVPVPP
jgi:WD40 repeat protein